MDKHNRISIKINGKEPKVNQEKKSTSKLVEKEKPLIIVENEEVAAAQEKEEDDFNWVLPDENFKNQTKKEKESPVVPIEDLRHTKGTSKIPYLPKKRKGVNLFSVKQFVISIVLAIIFGTGFGLMILNVVKDVTAGPAENENPTQVTEENPPQTDEQGDAPPASSQVSIELETLSTGIVQGGKFSTTESANTTVSDIKGKGFAATAIEMDGAFYVIAAIGSEQGAVSGIKAKYEEAFPEFFVKTIEVPGGSFSNAGKVDSEAINASLPVFKELLSLSSKAFGTGEIDNGQWENLSKQITTIKEIKKDDLHAQLNEFNTEIESAYTQLQAFKEGGNEKSLWQSQQSLLNAYQAYTVWISELS